MKNLKSSAAGPMHKAGGKPLKARILDNWQLYAMLLIPVVLTIIYKYIPMYGIQIAFRDYKASRGMFGSEWVGLKWFERFFAAPNCVRMLKNTLLLSLYSLLWSFPIPVILALMLNQVRFQKFKRATQTVLYAPHFISTMVICGMIRIFLSPSGGAHQPAARKQRRLSDGVVGVSDDLHRLRHLAGRGLGHHRLHGDALKH